MFCLNWDILFFFLFLLHIPPIYCKLILGSFPYTKGSVVKIFNFWNYVTVNIKFPYNFVYFLFKVTVLHCTCDLKSPSMQIWQWPIHNDSLETFIWSIILEDIVVFLDLKVSNSVNFYIFSCSRNAEVIIVEKSQ